MIKIHKKGNEVTLNVEILVPWGGGTWTWHPKVTFDNDWSACFWAEAVAEQLGARLKSIRQRAYDRGWADAKAKRAKRPEWATTLNDV